MSANVTLNGITPYLHHDDITAMIAWLTHTFGFVEKGRWVNSKGRVTNTELQVSPTEVWLDGDPDWWKKRGRRPEEWIGVWMDNVDAMHARVQATGLNPEAPENKLYAVRVLQVKDPEGYTLGFM